MTTGDQLAYVLSAKNELSWGLFKSVFDSLIKASQDTVEDVPILRYRILRLLDSLGHCDFLFDKGVGSIFVCPATVARLPLRECVGVLTGARSPGTLAALDKISRKLGDITISIEETDGTAFVPSRVTVRSHDIENLKFFCREAGLVIEAEPPCWKLATFSADIDTYTTSLKWVEGHELNWKSWQFEPEYCEFRSARSESGASRLMRYLDPVRNIFRYRLWRETRYANVDADWGRYIVLRESGFNVLFYDQMHHILAIPRNAYLPRLLQRAVGLCSGMMPFTYNVRSNDRKAMDLFQSVPPKVAEIISHKVGQSLSYCRLASEAAYRE
jgi:hypothetical protein